MTSKRADSWKIKTSPELFLPVWESKHEAISEEISKSYRSIDELYENVKPILDKHGIAGNQRLLYRSFAEELWKLKQKYSGKTLRIQSDAVAFKYCFYDADWRILKEIGYLLGLNLFEDLMERYKEAFEKAITLLDPKVAQNPLTINILYAPDGKVIGLDIYDYTLNKKKSMVMEYDENGRLYKITEAVENL